MEKFDGEEGAEDRRKKSDCFIVDMENLSSCTDKDNMINTTRISLQRILSRKGSQRIERKSGSDRDATNGGNEGVVSGSPRGPCTPEKSTVVQMPVMEAVVHTVNSQLQQPTQTNAESKFKRFNKQRSTWIHPWRILFVFAVLSSMGSILLIYLTLSMRKFNGDNNSQM